MQVFFITVYLIIIDNWILTLLVKITPNLIKKNVQYQINCDSSKKKIPFSVPYVTIFLNNFLHLLLNRCELSWKHFWLTALFLLHWVLVSCISPNISFLLLLFFPGYIKWAWRVFHKTFYQMSIIENPLGPIDYTVLNIYCRVRVMRLSWK